MLTNHLRRIHSFVALAFAMLLVIAVRHAQLASGEMEGWNDWSRASWMGREMIPSLMVWPSYVWDQSTEQNYNVQDLEFHGKYTSLRSKLDYNYHSNYSKSRQLLQDSIIDSILNATFILDQQGQVCGTPSQPWIVFTAGAMGAGKTHSLRQLASRGRFPLHSFVTVDPDDIRHHLPEFSHYLKTNPERAGEWTRKEAGFVAELLTQAALEQGKNVLVDGSLRDASWYRRYFSELRLAYKQLKIGILHITAPRELVFQRAHERSKTTGRVVPHQTLREALEQVPKSVQVLKPFCDFFAEIQNARDLELVSGTWETFQQAWSQDCRQRDRRRAH